MFTVALVVLVDAIEIGVCEIGICQFVDCRLARNVVIHRG